MISGGTLSAVRSLDAGMGAAQIRDWQAAAARDLLANTLSLITHCLITAPPALLLPINPTHNCHAMLSPCLPVSQAALLWHPQACATPGTPSPAAAGPQLHPATLLVCCMSFAVKPARTC